VGCVALFLIGGLPPPPPPLLLPPFLHLITASERDNITRNEGLFVGPLNSRRRQDQDQDQDQDGKILMAHLKQESG
jgi:hypothetical protein